MLPAQAFEEFGDGNHRLILGDALDVLASLPAGSQQLIFADPPYNIGKQFGSFVDRWDSEDAYIAWCERWLSLCIERLAPTGSLYLIASTQAMPRLDLFLRSRLHILSRIVWHYDSSGVQARRRFGSMYEPIVLGVKDPTAYTFNADAIKVEARTGAVRRLIDYRKSTPTIYNSHKVPGNVWYFPRVRFRMPEYEDHPAQKPEALLERIVRASSQPGDCVLDPFAGTFTTSAVARRLGRRSIGIELQPEFVQVGVRRLGLAAASMAEDMLPPARTTPRQRPKRRTR